MFDLGFEVRHLVSKYADIEGTTPSAAIRDILTELVHCCRERGLSFDERVEAAQEVADEELATERS